MADSNANTYTLGTHTEALAQRPRSLATEHGGSTSRPRFVMLGERIIVPTGPVSWVSYGAADSTGASYVDGPGALDPLSIVVAGRG